MVVDVVIRGCERSGTNITHDALCKAGLLVNQTYKHTSVHSDATADIPLEATVLLVVKHPVSWALSLYRRDWYLHWMPNAAQVQGGVASWRDPLDCMQRGNVFDHWNEFNREWIDAGDAVLRYEDLLRDPQQALSAALRCNVTLGDLVPTHFLHGRGVGPDPFDATYYTEERWRDEVGAEHYKLAAVCEPLMRELGYE